MWDYQWIPEVPTQIDRIFQLLFLSKHMFSTIERSGTTVSLTLSTELLHLSKDNQKHLLRHYLCLVNTTTGCQCYFIQDPTSHQLRICFAWDLRERNGETVTLPHEV